MSPAATTSPPARRRGPIDGRLLQLAPALRAHLVRSGLLAVALAVVVVVQAQVVADHLPALVDGDRSSVAPLAAALGLVALARWVVRSLGERSSAAAVMGTRRSVTDAVLDHVARTDEAGAAAATPARVTALITSGVDALEPWIRNYLPALCVAAVVPIVAWVRILVADPISALVLAVAVPLIPVFMVLIGQFTQERTDRQWAALQRLAGHFHEVLTGLVTLRLFGRADDQVRAVRATSERYRVAVMATLRVAFLSALALELLATLSVALVAVQVGVRLSSGSMVLATGLVVLLLAPEVSLPLRRVGAAYHAGLTGLDAAAEVAEVLRLGTTPDGPIDSLADGTVVVHDLGVDDPERGTRVRHVNAVVRPGELVALVGPSGAGKSTVLAALRGRVEPSVGTVRLGGAPVHQLSRRARAALIAHVAASPSPVGATVAESVRLGAPASTAAQVDELLQRLGLGGREPDAPSELSGGELRRLTVARAALRIRTGDARVLLADEPTAHLDPELRSAVAGLLVDLARQGATVVVATHDPTLMAVADQVVNVGATTTDPVAADPAAVDPGSVDTASASAVDRHATPESPPTSAAPAVAVRRLPATGLALPGGGATSAPLQRGSTPSLLEELRWLRRLGGPARGRVLGARALGVAADGCAVALAGTAAWLIVRAAEQPSFADLAIAAVAVRAFGVGKAVLRYAERLASHDATFRLLGAVRAAVVARLARVVPAGVPELSRGELGARVVDDVDRLADLELRVVSPTLSAATVGCLSAVAVGWWAPGAGAVLLAAVAVGAAVLPGLAARGAARAARQRAGHSDRLAADVMELAEHLDELAGNDAIGQWRTRIDHQLAALGVLDLAEGRRTGRLEGAAAALGAATSAATALALGAAAATPTGPMVGVAVLVPLAVAELLAPLVQAGSLRAVVGAAGVRLRAVLAAPDAVVEPEQPAPLPADDEVEWSGVGATWPGAGAPVLHGVDLIIAPGARLQVVGSSGSGKSTVAALLVRFLAPGEGRYLLGGVDTSALGGDQVRRRVTWVPQQPWIADTSVRENLRLANPDAADDELWAALARVRLDDWVRSMPEGLQTRLGPGGVTASGGQRQRLSLARVLLAGHRVVVLDEPTAQLDAATADVVLLELLDALDGRSLVVLGHEPVSLPGLSDDVLDLAEVGGSAAGWTGTQWMHARPRRLVEDGVASHEVVRSVG